MLENIRNRSEIEFIENCEKHKIVKQQSELTFNGIHKPYTSHSSFTFKQKEIVMDKPIYVGSACLELSKLHMFEA